MQSDTGIPAEKGNPSAPMRSRTYGLQITSFCEDDI